MTSSKTDTAPWVAASSTTRSRWPGAGTVAPEGSSTTAATWPAWSARTASRWSVSSPRKATVRARVAAGTPCGPGGGPDVPVVPPVVAAHQHEVAPGVGPRGADRGADRVGPALGEAHLLDAGAQGDDPLRHLDLERVHQGEGDAVVELGPHRVVDHRLGVAEEDGPEGHGLVDPLVAVDVPEVGAPCPAPRGSGARPRTHCEGCLERVWVPRGMTRSARAHQLVGAGEGGHSRSVSTEITLSWSAGARPGWRGSDRSPA